MCHVVELAVVQCEVLSRLADTSPTADRFDIDTVIVCLIRCAQALTYVM